MSLIIATGSNLNDPIKNLELAKLKLESHFKLISESKIYQSKAVDYLNQPDFFNQVLEFKLPESIHPESVMKLLLNLEIEMGRVRDLDKGPRIIDLDIIFWGTMNLSSNILVTPHPSWIKRSFVVRPLMELPFFKTIEKCFTIPKVFDVDAFPIN